MAILEKIQHFFAPPKVEDSTAGGQYRYWVGASSSGKYVTEHNAMQLTAVYACVRVIAEAVASLPLHMYENDGEGGKTRAESNRLYFLLHDEPNPEMTSFNFRETMMTHLLLWGNAYAQIIRSQADGSVIGLYPLMPSRMTVDRNEGGMIEYRYNMQEDDGAKLDEGIKILTPRDVLHIPGLGFDGLVGYSPIAMAKNAIGLTIAAEEFGSKFFANGAAPSGVLEFPGPIKDPQKVRESWGDGFSGGNSHRIAILEEGMKYTPISIPPNEAQFLETRKFQVDEIARIFRVPPHMIGDLERSSFNNIEQQSLEFVKYTLDPWVTRWEQSLNRALLRKEEKGRYFFKFNVDGLMRGDYKSRMEGYATAVNNGIMSINDVRALENMDLVADEDGGNLHVVNGNMVPLKDAGAAYKSGKEEDES